MPGGKKPDLAGRNDHKRAPTGEGGIRRKNARSVAGPADKDAPLSDDPPTARTRRPRWSWRWPWIAALLLCTGFAAPTVAAPNAQEQAAIDQVNLRRGQIGLPALTYNQNLELSSRGHANYLALNNTSGHFQTSTLGFTGVDPSARISATAYGAPLASNEVISFGASTGIESIEGLIQAIYHRFGIFATNVRDIGTGFITSHPTFTNGLLVVNSAAQSAVPPMPDSWVGVYPFDGQTGVTRDFFSNTESPDPVTGSDRVGYPISLHVDGNRVLNVSSFTIKPVGGSALSAQLLTAATDPNNETPASAAALIPLAPLAYGTEHEAVFVGTANGTPLSKTWRFTTGPLLPITFSPAQPYLAYNSSLVIEISGGSGVYTGASTFYSPPSPGDVAFIGPHTLRITSPASGQSAVSGSLTLTVTDSEGNTGQVTVTVQPTVADPTPPSVPTGLTATAVSASQINLAWNAATDNVAVTAYQVFRAGVFRATVNAPTVSFSDTGLSASTAYSYTVAACDAAGNCSAPSSAASATTTTASGSTYTANLEPGFNLIGNSLNVTLSIATTFGNQDAQVAGVTPNIVSIWKWNAVDGRWAFYSPQLTVAGINTFAAGKGYDVLAAINPGEGYWVNAISQFTLPAQSGSDFSWSGANFSTLPSGFSLIAHAGAVTPSQFNIDVSQTPPAPGTVPTDNFVTLWAWDAVQTKWYFYSPLLESSGGLAAVKSYADSKFFLHFQDLGKTLGIGTGFWVNRP